MKNKTVFTMGGKGGVGKTTLIGSLVEYYLTHEIPVSLLDLDSENKKDGSLGHFFPQAQKVDIKTKDGLDIFIECAQRELITLADMGGGSGEVTYRWFDDMYPLISDTVSFVAVGVVTSDPASVRSVLDWSRRIGKKAKYMIVLNYGENEEFDDTYWNTEQVAKFQATYQPTVIEMKSRLSSIQNALRNHGAKLTDLASGALELPELAEKMPSSKLRAKLTLNQMFAEFDRIKELLLP